MSLKRLMLSPADGNYAIVRLAAPSIHLRKTAAEAEPGRLLGRQSADEPSLA